MGKDVKRGLGQAGRTESRGLLFGANEVYN